MPDSSMTLNYQGSVKNVYQDTRTAGVNYFDFTDDYSIFDWGKMPDTIANKGKALSIMGGAFFRHLTQPGSWEKLPEQPGLQKFNSAFLSRVFGTESYQRLKQAGLQHHFLGWVNAQGEPVKIEQLSQIEDAPLMKVRSIDVTRPRRFTLDQHTLYNYDQLGTPTYGHPFLIPLEVIFRFGIPEGSSMGERLEGNPHYHAELGLTQVPQPNTWFERPVVEFFTKLEAKDRYLTPQEAFFLSGLGESQFVQLYDKTLLVALWLYDAFSLMGIELWDGKLEFAWTPEGLMLVDSIGPDELRLKVDGVHLSKEAIRQFYRETPWEQSLKQAKHDCLSRPGSDWREICEIEYQATPELLTPTQKRIVDSLYGALANRILGESVIATELTLDEVVEALRQHPAEVC